MKKTFLHTPVLLKEVIEGIALHENDIYIDATIGGAGHAWEILKSRKGIRLFAFDQDVEAIDASKKKLKRFLKQATFFHKNFKEAPELLKDFKGQVGGILVDLGVSSHQLDSEERGFSFKNDGKLDMRMNTAEEFSAVDVVNGYSEEKLADIIFEYGEERFSRRIARSIVRARELERITTTGQLAEIVRKSVQGDPLKNIQRTFQAIRIEVNNELHGLEEFIKGAVELLKPGGRLAVISFHSLEDRIVKNTFKELATDCICPPRALICTCNHKATVQIITKKPIEASEEESRANSRSHSAKLRIIEKL